MQGSADPPARSTAPIPGAGRMRLLDVTRDVVLLVAPEEEPLLMVLAQLDDTEVLRRLKRRRTSDPLGFGLGEGVALVTRVVWLAVYEVADRMTDVAADGMRARIGAWLGRQRRRHQSAGPLPRFGEAELEEVQAKVVELATKAGMETPRAEDIGIIVADRLAHSGKDPAKNRDKGQESVPDYWVRSGQSDLAGSPLASRLLDLVRAVVDTFLDLVWPVVNRLLDLASYVLDTVLGLGWAAGNAVRRATSALVGSYRRKRGDRFGLDEDTLPVTIYLSDEGIHDQVEAAVSDLLDAAGLDITHRDEPVIGSWFRRMRAVARSPAAREGALVAAHAADARLVLAQDAVNTATMLQNLGPVIGSLQPTKDAVLRVGALLIVKADWIVNVFQLTAAQQALLDHRPQLDRSPHEIIAALNLTEPGGNTDGPLGLQ